VFLSHSLIPDIDMPTAKLSHELAEPDPNDVKSSIVDITFLTFRGEEAHQDTTPEIALWGDGEG
jgi:hypothetical protein